MRHEADCSDRPSGPPGRGTAGTKFVHLLINILKTCLIRVQFQLSFSKENISRIETKDSPPVISFKLAVISGTLLWSVTIKIYSKLFIFSSKPGKLSYIYILCRFLLPCVCFYVCQCVLRPEGEWHRFNNEWLLLLTCERRDSFVSYKVICMC
jgi:hypothetical protein